MAPDRDVRVTPHVSPDEVEDLLARPTRAAVAFVGPDGPECVPALFRRDGGIGFAVHPAAFGGREAPERVVLVLDDGVSWFELRGALWRGAATPAEEAGDGLLWFRLEPRGATAWDYGRVHEEPVP